tara:strand:+ start:127 stop:369 length:243 start_codon:yes stop_codon:yes gene_type:complete
MENNGELSPLEDAEFRRNALDIITLVEANEEMFTIEEHKAISLANDALEFWISEGNVRRAYWETQNSLNIIENIVKSHEV